ncbi:methyltransferase domain-containing protein [Aneurinibacillus sp. Ricciae_BoGa-3]|uniref:class I SAM-dependent methyltransferase n=1 Tax=Aneurinibacillus sp. Ricciae_BoGa-3 TaxID=3022697 RepID=UPI0023425D99|nr:class I SAM-dependent methyltransferase [Aneurinibacillus sp. Ricciae_BoGa-3]WCK54455.1 methyltransferase domain-containing protein [Aneurinibacillus sp. Ricciae_BoGa-3]
MLEDDSIKDKVRKQFAKNAEKYVTSESHAKGKDLSLLIEWAKPQPDWVVLDIATGGGHTARTLSPHAGHVFATDMTRQMLANTARHLRNAHPNIWYVVSDAEQLPFLDDTFDLATCRIAAHHFPNPDQFISEVFRTLKAGGTFILIDNVAPGEARLADFMNSMEKLRDESHVRCLSINEWRGLFAAAGLEEAKTLTRKKTYDYPTWVNRTTVNSEQIARVTNFILHADKDIQGYFSVDIHNDDVRSLQVDEWMVLCRKPCPPTGG